MEGINFKACVAEFIGTFALIYIGVGAIAADHVSGGAAGLTGIALAHGLTIAVMVSATMYISGGQLNPAVTVGVFVARKLGGGQAVANIVSQCLGAIVAAILVKLSLASAVLDAVGMGTPALGEGVTAFQGVLVEAVLTFFLVFVVLMTAVDPRAHKVGGLFIGLTVALDILMGGPITGAAMNPARHLGPALMGGGMGQTWIYWVGPVLGGVVAGLVYCGVLEEKK
jgi:aquaporin Z